MNPELPLVTLSAWFFFARKFSSWGWVATSRGILPRPLRELWEAWRDCPFCGGFWIALGFKALTGWMTLPAIGAVSIPWYAAWFLDGLVTSMVVLGAASAVMRLVAHPEPVPAKKTSADPASAPARIPA